MLKVVNLIRKLYPDTVIIVDDYDNYYVYGSDSYIVYYLINLSIKRYKNSLFIKNKIEYINYLIDSLNKSRVNYEKNVAKNIKEYREGKKELSSIISSLNYIKGGTKL